jgi:hypothetical protein
VNPEQVPIRANRRGTRPAGDGLDPGPSGPPQRPVFAAGRPPAVSDRHAFRGTPTRRAPGHHHHRCRGCGDAPVVALPGSSSPVGHRVHVIYLKGPGHAELGVRGARHPPGERSRWNAPPKLPACVYRPLPAPEASPVFRGAYAPAQVELRRIDRQPPGGKPARRPRPSTTTSGSFSIR